LIYSQNACDAADNPNRAADDSADRTCSPLAFAGTTFNTSGQALS
jgi:hypothetical protein